MIKSLRNITTLLIAALAIVFVSCKKDPVCELNFPVGAAFVGDWGASTTLKFTYRNAKVLEVRDITGGWKAEVDKATRTLTVTAPSSPDAEEASPNGTIHVVAVAEGGDSEGAIIYGYIVNGDIDLSANGAQSNSYIISQPNAKYRFNACVKGNSTETIPTAKIDVLWCDEVTNIRYLSLDDDGYASFFVSYDTDDNGKELTISPKGNTILAAYDSAGTILWSWHLWLTGGDDPRDGFTLSNGTTIMGYNLGALANPNASTDTYTIWSGYGLYYQWGRKDPFLRPEYYDCANNIDETIYNSDEDYLYVKVKESTAKVGTVEYAVKNPLTFISSTAENQGNWLYQNNRDDLWSATGKKSMYDPCPYGWRVPAKDAFDVLDIAAADDAMPLDQAKKQYGWYLADKATGEKYFFPASGYRSYYDGIISNINYRDEYPYTPMPWVGYYWTAGAGSTAATSSAMYFDLNTSRATVNGFKAVTDQKRGNAMQIRCVKE